MTAITVGIRSGAKVHNMNSKDLEGAMFNWKAREYAQEIFAVALAIGAFLTLAAVIPA